MLIRESHFSFSRSHSRNSSVKRSCGVIINDVCSFRVDKRLSWNFFRRDQHDEWRVPLNNALAFLVNCRSHWLGSLLSEFLFFILFLDCISTEQRLHKPNSKQKSQKSFFTQTRCLFVERDEGNRNQFVIAKGSLFSRLWIINYFACSTSPLCALICHSPDDNHKLRSQVHGMEAGESPTTIVCLFHSSFSVCFICQRPQLVISLW